MVMIEVGSVAGGSVLAGGAAGEGVRPRLERIVSEAPPGSVIVLDFGEVELVTSSYFLAAFGWIWTSPATRERDLFPVLANVNAESTDEIALALAAKGLRAQVGIYADGQLRDLQPSKLEETDRETYRLVEQLGEARASDLFRADPRIQPTAWSNRLNLLYGYRLLRRQKRGRQLVYSVSWR